MEAQAAQDYGGNPVDYKVAPATDEEHAALVAARDEASLSPLDKCYRARREAYGSIPDQLDMMFHGTWEAHIQAVKDANPKPD